MIFKGRAFLVSALIIYYLCLRESELELRERLRRIGVGYFEVFDDLVSRLRPLLSSIEQQFPEYTRHDPSHNERLEAIAADLLRPEVKDSLTAPDLFALLCALWIHDAGMGMYEPIEAREKRGAPYIEKLARFQRLGHTEAQCWREYVRENHHIFCSAIAADYLGGRTSNFLTHWIGVIGRSHGERQIHDRTIWPKRVAVGETERLHPPLIAAILRLADILHFSRDRAPEYMLEHRHVKNTLSIAHWHAHQVAAGYTIDDDVCFFDGVTTDDEAYWFAQQFFDSMEGELRYCKADVFPTIDQPFSNPLTFSRVERRIRAEGFSPATTPVTLRVEAPKLLEDLLNDALYAGKPAWFRELLQNAFDACRDRAMRDQGADPSVTITATTQPDRISFSDTGIGMQRPTVQNFLLVAGASFWSSAEYRAEPTPRAGHVGRFGIGFMSVFAVAKEAVVETRHASDAHGWRFVIRSPRQVVRVEELDRTAPGTTVTLTLKPGTLSLKDPQELLSETCSYPEFPVSLVVDGTVEQQFETCRVPALDDEGFALRRGDGAAVEGKLVSREIREDGIRGTFQMPKLYIRELRAFIPDMRGWLRGAGWDVTGESKTYYGGINYPPLHAISAPAGFSHVPSIGVLRLAVSPNNYPLEMNLARDSFAAGEGTQRLFETICRILDGFLSEDLNAELAEHGDPLERSVIAGLHSWTLLNLWVGQVPSLSMLALSEPSSARSAIRPTPWPRLTNAMQRVLTFRTLDRFQNLRSESLESLLDAGAIVFGAGTLGRGISRPLQDAVFGSHPDARLLLEPPHPDFGVVQLRHWACEEILVPVEVHGRCAFGLRLARDERPFGFFPRESECLGIPVASGPEQFAFLDYRDFMAEAAFQPTGGPMIVAVLNRRNPKIARFLEALHAFPDYNSLRRKLGNAAKELRSSFTVGNMNTYSGRIAVLISFVNATAATLGVEMPPILPTDSPAYLTAGTVTPFGRSMISILGARALQELQGYETGFGPLA